MIKRITSFVLAFIMLITCLTGTTILYAADNEFIVDESETVLIDSIEYKYQKVLVDGKEITYIINVTENIKDILSFDSEKGIVFLNDKPIAYVEKTPIEVNDTLENRITPFAATGWRYHDTSNHKITWVKGVSAAVLAAIIAEVIPATSWITVLAKIGAAALGVVSAACIGGNVKCVAYTQTLLDGKVQCRYDWTFTPSTGEHFGPYSSYQL